MIRTLNISGIPPSPDSPPGMTTSKSSKSSSFQSFSSDDGSVLADVSHFEDIGLDDDTVTLKSPSEISLRSLPPKTPSGRTLAAGRTASKARPPFPSLQTNVYTSNPRSTNLSALTDPTSATRSKPLTSPSSSSLPFPRRHRTPSPSYSLNPRDPSLPPKPRRGSWQANRERKSFTDLERECDEDDGDDIPDGLVLDNVPISPRPPQERTPSRPSSVSPSPDRGPKERVRSIGNGTPAVAQAQGSLRSPTWKTDGPPRSPMKARAHSWNAALAELNAEAKALTEKLEEHAGELEENQGKRPNAQRPNTWSSARRSVDTSYDKKQRVKSTPELPPLRKTNIMIDPLPVSREKEAVLSRTRPSWLPPKDPAEERRHLREYQKMMAASAKAEERREASRRAKIEGRDSQADHLMHIWEKDIVPRWPEAIRERRTRELWWKGIAPRSRGVVWARALGNELGLSESSFRAALTRAKEVEARVEDDKGDAEDARRAKWFEEIRKDTTENTWEDLRIFEVGGPLHQNLVDVLSAYAMYRSDIGYVSGCNTIAALLLLNLPDAGSAFVALANVLNRSLPLSFYASDLGAQASAFNLVLQTLSLKSTALHEHLTKKVQDIQLEDSLGELFTAMFTGHLAIDEAARLWDVYVFEGDALLIRAAVAFLLSREMPLLGAKTAGEVKAILAERNANVSSARVAGEVGAEDKFMMSVREAGKA